MLFIVATHACSACHVQSAVMNVIGLLGGIASGKSLIANHLVQRGAVLLDADRIGHEVLKAEAVKAAARERWGDKIFGVDGEIHRPALAAIVFAPPPAGPAELKYLEDLTHPSIRQSLQHHIEEIRREGSAAAIVLDAPVMLKAGWNRFCDKIVFVESPKPLRWKRAEARGWTREDFERREAAQESLDLKRRLADVVIDNSGSLAETYARVDRLWPMLIRPVIDPPSVSSAK
jgi:dephospho-CoA kinase